MRISASQLPAYRGTCPGASKHARDLPAFKDKLAREEIWKIITICVQGSRQLSSASAVEGYDFACPQIRYTTILRASTSALNVALGRAQGRVTG